MKRKFLRVLAAVLIVAGAWTIAPVACVQQQPVVEISALNSEQIILRAEQAAETAKVTFDTFVHLERDNESVLKQVNPQIHVYANTIRTHGIDWIVALRNATKAFKANRTADNRANLNTVLLTLLAAIGDTNSFIQQSRNAIHQ